MRKMLFARQSLYTRDWSRPMARSPSVTKPRAMTPRKDRSNSYGRADRQQRGDKGDDPSPLHHLAVSRRIRRVPLELLPLLLSDCGGGDIGSLSKKGFSRRNSIASKMFRSIALWRATKVQQ